MVDATSHMASKSRETQIDRYLAGCVKCQLASLPLPSWPAGLDEHQALLASRVSYHGIALLLWEGGVEAAGWPLAAQETVREEAIAQSFWEQSHHTVISQLLENMVDEGAEPVVTKGTAIAYSLYRKPAARRRGDTDIVVPPSNLSKARRSLERQGFARHGAPQIFQETWLKEQPAGFAHLVDLHWQIDGSATVSAHLKRGDVSAKTAAVPALSPRAIGMDPMANLLLICLNRSEHISQGYIVGDQKVSGADRLIWAVDIDATCSVMTDNDWEDLAALIRRTGSASSVISGLEFASDTLSTKVPRDALGALAEGSAENDLSLYLSSQSAWRRLRFELAYSPRWLDKFKHLTTAAGPREEVLRERFPTLDNWPVSALRVRRLLEGLFKAMRGQI